MSNELKIPVIGEYVRNIGRLVRVDVINPPPPPSYEEFIFEEITAKIELRRNGKLLKDICELNDFYGLESSVKSAIDDAIAYCNDNQIDTKSELEVVIVKVVTQVRKIPTYKSEFWTRENWDENKGWMDFKPCDNYRYRQDVAEPVETVVWSSKDGK